MCARRSIQRLVGRPFLWVAGWTVWRSRAHDDGTAGLAAIKERGGIAVVEDPEDGSFLTCRVMLWKP